MMHHTEQNNHEPQDARNTVLTEKVFKWWDYPLFILMTGLSLSVIYRSNINGFHACKRNHTERSLLPYSTKACYFMRSVAAL